MTNNAEVFDAQTEASRFRRTRIALLVILALCGVELLAEGWSGYLFTQAAKGVDLGTEAASGIDSRAQAIVIAQLLAALVTAVLWLTWLSRAYRNLRAVGSRETQHSPGWAIGSWFVPILNIIRPYYVMRETLSRSAQANRTGYDKAIPPTQVAGLWWLMLYVSNGASRASNRAMEDAKNAADLVSANYIDIAETVSTMIAAMLAIQLARTIHEYQQGVCADSAKGGAPPLV